MQPNGKHNLPFGFLVVSMFIGMGIGLVGIDVYGLLLDSRFFESDFLSPHYYAAILTGSIGGLIGGLFLDVMNRNNPLKRKLVIKIWFWILIGAFLYFVVRPVLIPVSIF